MDLPDLLTDWIVGAPTLETVGDFVTNNYIIDVRSAADFGASHIENAVNSPLADVLTAAENSGGKPIVVVCYSGQSAGHAVVALRLSGYSNAKVLKFGMSGWNADFSGPWLGNSGDNGNHGVGHANWNTNATTAPVKSNAPVWSGTASTGQALLQERVQFMLSEGFKGISGTDVLAAPQNYFINNFWAATDTEHYGHIEGAYRMFPMSIANEDFLNLDPEKQIVTYCWTGQTSSMVTAYLTVLGYDASSLRYGVNSMIYSQLEGHQFVLPSVNLPVVNE
jgi:rhodanese-related sulfurtransferase